MQHIDGEEARCHVIVACCVLLIEISDEDSRSSFKKDPRGEAPIYDAYMLAGGRRGEVKGERERKQAGASMPLLGTLENPWLVLRHDVSYSV